jgi:hypothetical protein
MGVLSAISTYTASAAKDPFVVKAFISALRISSFETGIKMSVIGPDASISAAIRVLNRLYGLLLRIPRIAITITATIAAIVKISK